MDGARRHPIVIALGDAAITQANRARLQAHLRTVLHSPGLTLDPPETQGGTAQLRVGDDVLGTVD